MKMNDVQRLQRIVCLGNKLEDILREHSITDEMILNDTATQWMITTPLYDIGEQCNNISQELVDGHPEIPFVQVAGLRHRLVHDYVDTNWNIILVVIRDELPDFLMQIRRVMGDIDK